MSNVNPVDMNDMETIPITSKKHIPKTTLNMHISVDEQAKPFSQDVVSYPLFV